MKYLSVCSGIEAATQAWHPLGWEPVAFSEIDDFPSRVLAHHYPDVPNLGDMSKYKEWSDVGRQSIRVLVGGTPCQSFSVAGLRKGLDDPRGNLMLTYLGIAERFRPNWVVWENVPGVLSSNGGRDFGSLLGGLAKLGYGFAYRVLDAQYVRVESHRRAVPQRRRRVFVVGYLGDWRRAAAVLFERESLCGHPPPSRKAGEEVAGTFTARADSGGWSSDVDLASSGYMRPVPDVAHTLTQRHDSSEDGGGRGTPIVPEVANPLTARMHKGVNTTCDEGQTMITVAEVGGTLTQGFGDRGLDHEQITNGNCAIGFHNRQDPDVSGEVSHPIGSKDTGMGVAIPINTQNASRDNDHDGRCGTGIGEEGDPCPSITQGHSHAVAFAQNSRDEVREMEVTGALAAEPGAKQTSYLRSGMVVRRLTPRECERLQGFPDDFTKVPNKQGKLVDGPRYKVLGNSMAVNVMRWIGDRIQAVEELSK